MNKPAPIPALIEQHTIPDKKTKPVAFSDLILSGMQLRVSISQEAVARYAEAYQAKADIPAIVVFKDADSGQYWLADGHHRVAAAKKAGLTKLDAIVKQGTILDALLYGARSNHAHGEPLTNDDKRHTVARFLDIPEWRKKSDRWIGTAAQVSPHLVAKVRKTLPKEQQSTVRESKDGTTRDTKNIGRKAKLTPTEPERGVLQLAKQIVGARPGLNPLKALILAALAQVPKGCAIDRKTLAEKLNRGTLDVHPGQLAREGLITAHDGMLVLTDAGLRLINEATGETPQDRAERQLNEAMDADLPDASLSNGEIRRRILLSIATAPEPTLGQNPKEIATCTGMTEGEISCGIEELHRAHKIVPVIIKGGKTTAFTLTETGLAEIDAGQPQRDEPQPRDETDVREPEELNADTVASTAGDNADAVPPPIMDDTLAARRVVRVRELLAEQLLKGKPQCCASDRSLVSLALVVGVPVSADDEAWSDDLPARCWTLFADRLRVEVADRLTRGETTKLPPLDQLAGWWGINIQALAIQAERAVKG